MHCWSGGGWVAAQEKACALCHPTSVMYPRLVPTPAHHRGQHLRSLTTSWPRSRTQGWEEAASHFAGCSVKLRTASAALLQCTAASWREALGGALGARGEAAGAGGKGAGAAAGAKAPASKWQLVDVLVPVVQGA